jgi:hypothetical protein
MNPKHRTAGIVSAIALTAGSVGMVAGPASAALPEFPNNLVLFPDRDFITVEGYEGSAEDTGIIRVYRGDVLVGYTESPMEAGGVAFEVNHPGGVCWGVNAPNAGLKVTPDLQGGDRVELELKSSGVKDDVTVQAVRVLSETRDGSIVTVVSEAPADIPLDRVEGRIIQPDLKDTEVGRRDARAVDGTTGDTGYASTLARDDAGHVVATYTFESAGTAQVALDGTSRIMAWQATQGGERVGITIAEHEELGGPGMGGCPAGPGDAAQPAPGGANYIRSGDQMVVQWTPATPVAGGGTVTGYQVTATDAAGNIVGRKAAASDARATITGMASGTEYTVEVRAAVGARLSEPFTVAPTEPTDPGTVDPGPVDETPPTLTASQGEDGSVSVQSDGQVYFTLGDTEPFLGDMPSDTAVLYEGPITVTEAGTKINFAAFDQAGNKTLFSGTYEPVAAPPAPAPLAAPTLSSATAGPGNASLSWTQVADAVDYQVKVVNKATGTPLATQPPATTARAQRVDGLAGGTAYTFTVVARAGDRVSPDSNTLDATPAVVLSKPAIIRAQWRTGDLRIEGTSDVTTGTVRFFKYDNVAKKVTTTPVGTQVTVTAAVAPETGGQFVLRARNAAAGTTNPGWIVAVAGDGGTSAPFQTANR